jgi:hypothetical protein
VELVRLYSNLSDEHRLLCDVAAAASTTRRARSAQQRPRQRQYRLNQAQVAELIAAYRQRKSINELARRYDCTEAQSVLCSTGITRGRAAGHKGSNFAWLSPRTAPGRIAG